MSSSLPPPSYDEVVANDANNFASPPTYQSTFNNSEYLQEGKSPSKLYQVRVVCPSINVSKIFHFSLDETIWAAKMKVINEFKQQKCGSHLQDALNFGFFYEPHARENGVYIDEQILLRSLLEDYPIADEELEFRPRQHCIMSSLLKDYPIAGKDWEFRPKLRIYSKPVTHRDKTLHEAANSEESRRKCSKLIRAGDVFGMEKLLQSGLDPNLQDEEKGYHAPLIHAAMIERCSYELIKVLVEYGAHLDIRSSKGETAVHIAIAAGNDTVLQHLQMADASLDYRDGDGLTPLYRDICGRGGYLTNLVAYGAEIGISDINGYQEIHRACKLGGWHLEKLIAHGADVNSVTKEWNTPLHLCAQNNNLQCARILLDHGANVNAMNCAQCTPYDICLAMGHQKMASLLQSESGSIVNDASVKNQNLGDWNNMPPHSSNTKITVPTAPTYDSKGDENLGGCTSIQQPSLNLPKQLEGKSLMDWSCDDVCLWLEQLELGQYKDTFLSNTIKGKHLPQLSKDELKELGVTKLGDRMTLEDEIGKLKNTTRS